MHAVWSMIGPDGTMYKVDCTSLILRGVSLGLPPIMISSKLYFCV